MRWNIIAWLMPCCLSMASSVSDENLELRLVPLPRQFEAAYYERKPEQFLVDPQRLLHGRDARERREFLEYHSNDSQIDLYLYLFKGDQQVPAGVSHGDSVARLFAGEKPVVVVYYYLGRPDRTAIYLSPELAEAVPLEDQVRALEIAVEQASSDTSPVKQLEKLSVQLAIRMYWMEQQWQRHNGVPGAAEEELLPAEKPEELEEPEKQRGWSDVAAEIAGAYWMPALLLLTVWFLRRRLRQRAQYRFEDLKVEPRFGCRHGAGVGAVISFSSTSPPPAAQKER